MDRSRAPGNGDRRSASVLSTDGLSGVCLERTLELEGAKIRLREWPGVAGPLIHVPDPLRETPLAGRLAEKLAPRYRILSILPRAGQPYQVHLMDVVGVLAQFGFERVVLAAEGNARASALLLAAWHPKRVGALALIDAHLEPSGEGVLVQSLRDCPPEWTRLRDEVRCAIVELAGDNPALAAEVEGLLSGPLP